MNKKIKVGLITCCSLLLLTGCSPVSHKTHHQEKKISVVKSRSSKKTVNEDGVRLSAKLTPKENASANKQNSEACYTLDNEQIFIYDNQTKLGSTTIDKMFK